MDYVVLKNKNYKCFLMYFRRANKNHTKNRRRGFMEADIQVPVSQPN